MGFPDDFRGLKVASVDIEGCSNDGLSKILGIGHVSVKLRKISKPITAQTLGQWLNKVELVFASAPDIPASPSAFQHPYFPFVLANQAVTPHSQEEMINTLISILEQHDIIVTYGNDWDYLLKHFTGTPEQLQKIGALLQEKILINPLNILIALDYGSQATAWGAPTLKLATAFKALWPKNYNSTAINKHDPASDAVMALAVLATCVSQSTNQENYMKRQEIVDRLLPILATSVAERKKILEKEDDLWLIYFHPPDGDKAGERTVQLVQSLGPDPLQPAHWLVLDGQHAHSVPLTAMPLLLTDAERKGIFQKTSNSEYRQPHVQPGTRPGVEPEEQTRLAGAYWKEELWGKRKLLHNAAAVTGAVIAVRKGLEKGCLTLKCHDGSVTEQGAKNLLTLLLKKPLRVTEEVLRIGRFFKEGRIFLTATVDTEAEGFASLPEEYQNILKILFNKDDPFPIVSLLNQHMTNAVACAGIGPFSKVVAETKHPELKLELEEVWVEPWREPLKKSVLKNLGEVRKGQGAASTQKKMAAIQLPNDINELYALLYSRDNGFPKTHKTNIIKAIKKVVYGKKSELILIQASQLELTSDTFKGVVQTHLGEDTQKSSVLWFQFLEAVVEALPPQDKQKNPLYIAWQEQAGERWLEEYYKAWVRFLENPAEKVLTIPPAPSTLARGLPPVVQTGLLGRSDEELMEQAMQGTIKSFRGH